ncbi:MAG: right-handed parallel beta-helix repeat-containing protein [Prolixibacteraceae bacterium]|nr:right-handed parallel beta-helix repeat-containing protein [Prolixibacteraceae bacterium]
MGVNCDGYLSKPLIENNLISDSNEEGIYFARAAGIIRNNTIKNSWNTSGIYCYMASPDIKGNYLELNGYGIYCRSGSEPGIEGNTITESYSYGIYCNGASPLIQKNQIIGNKGIGIYCENSSPQISSNLIRQNGGNSFSDSGRGTYDNHQRPYEQFVGGALHGGISINNNSNPVVQSNIIAENKGVNVGAVFCDDSSVPVIVNNHIVDNYSIYGGSLNIQNASAKIINNIVAGSKNSDANQGVCRWYKDDLFARYNYDGVILTDVTYYFGFINYGPPGNVEITGCQGFHQTVWAETGERFWVEAASGVFSGDWGGLNVTVSMESNSFTIVAKRIYNFVEHGCMTILSPEITSYGIANEGLAGAGIVIENQDNIPDISYNNLFGNPGGNYIFSDSVETKSALVFDLTGSNRYGVSSPPLCGANSYICE